MAGDNGLQVLSEVGIECDRGVPFLRLPEDLRDGPSAPVRRTNDRQWTLVLLHDYLGALRDLGQDGVNIAGEFGFRNASPRTARVSRFNES